MESVASVFRPRAWTSATLPTLIPAMRMSALRSEPARVVEQRVHLVLLRLQRRGAADAAPGEEREQNRSEDEGGRGEQRDLAWQLCDHGAGSGQAEVDPTRASSSACSWADPSTRRAREHRVATRGGAVGVSGRQRRVDVVAEPREPEEEALVLLVRRVGERVGGPAQDAERLLQTGPGGCQVASSRPDVLGQRSDAVDELPELLRRQRDEPARRAGRAAQGSGQGGEGGIDAGERLVQRRREGRRSLERRAGRGEGARQQPERLLERLAVRRQRRQGRVARVDDLGELAVAARGRLADDREVVHELGQLAAALREQARDAPRLRGRRPERLEHRVEVAAAALQAPAELGDQHLDPRAGVAVEARGATRRSRPASWSRPPRSSRRSRAGATSPGPGRGGSACP